MTPRRPSLVARWALIGAAALCLLWLARLDYARKISLNVLDLLPPAEQSPEAALIRDLASNTQARVVLFALHDAASPDTPPTAAAETFVEHLRASNAFSAVVPLGGSRAQDALGVAIFERRHRLLLPTWLGESEAEFAKSGRPASEFSSWLAERSAADLEAFLARPEALPMEQLILRDPLLLVPRLVEKSRDLAPGAAARGHALVWATLRASALDEAGQAPVFHAVERTWTAARGEHPQLVLQWTGVNRFAAASRARIEREISVLNVCSLGAVLLVSVAFARRAWRILHVAPVVALSLLGAWTATTLAFERVHVLVLVIGALLCGVAIDYAFYIFLQPPATPAEPYGDKLRRLLKPLLASCLTTVIGFSLLMLSDLPLLRQMGFFVGAGLLCALGAAMAYFAQVRNPFLETRAATRGGITRRFSRAALIASVALAALTAAAGAVRLEWRDDIRELEIPSEELRSNDRAVRALFGESANRTAFLTHGATLAEARERLGAFLAPAAAAHPDASIASVGQIFPTERDWNALPARLARMSTFAEDFRAALQRHGFDVDAFADFFRDWEAARTSENHPSYATLYAELAPHLTGPLAQLFDATGPSYWFLTLIDRPISEAPPPALRTLPVRQLETLNQLFTRYRATALRLSIGGLALVIASVFVIYRGAIAVRIALLPASACCFVLGVLGLLGRPLNFFHLLGAFLGTCLAHNYAIFSSGTSARGHPPPVALRLSACTTAASFGVLGFSAIPVIHALGVTVAAIVLCTLAFVELEARTRPAL